MTHPLSWQPTRGRSLWLQVARAALLALSIASATACGSGGGDEPSRQVASAASTRLGVDYSWARPSPSGLYSEGYTFAARYLSDDTTGKNLSKGEADALWAAGVDIVSNWEQSSTAALNGYSQGVSDAQTAQAQAAADGMPAGRPIYFSVDFDASVAQQGAIDSYFDGAASVLGVSRVGAYGGYYVIQRLFDAGKIAWGWQTYAWSGGQWDPRAQLRQVQNGITAAGDSDCCDEDQSVATDFGQWHAVAPPPPPSPLRGSLDAATCDSIAGWSQDPGQATTAIAVDIYLDGPAGTGTGLGRFTAGDSRPDLCSAIGSCNHAFTIQPPARLYDGRAHTVYAYGIAVTPGVDNALLGNAPKTLHCAATLTGNFHGTGDTEVVQFRDDWQTLPACGRWGSNWSCGNQAATYVGGMGAGNAGTAIYPGATALVGDVNGDGRDDILQYDGGWQSVPVCFSVASGWSCENMKAAYVGGLSAGNAGTGIYAGATPLVGDVNGDGKADLLQYSPGWVSIPVCFSTGSGWSCQNLKADYVGGLGAGTSGTGIYDAPGTTAFVADVNGDGKADLVQYNAEWSSIPVCFSTGSGWSCKNLEAAYAGGIGAGNGGTGVYGAKFGTGTTALMADVNGDGKADLAQYNPGWASVPVCFSTGSGWSCRNLKATYIGGMGSGNAGTGIFGSAQPLLADVNGDGAADLIQYSEGWQSIPVCFSTRAGWACDNLKANYTGAASGAGNAGTGIHPFGVPLTGTFPGSKFGGLVQIDPGSGWKSLPICELGDTGWECSNDAAPVY